MVMSICVTHVVFVVEKNILLSQLLPSIAVPSMTYERAYASCPCLCPLVRIVVQVDSHSGSATKSKPGDRDV